MQKLSEKKQDIAREVTSKQEKFWKISDAIWSYAELGLEEYKSSELLAITLDAHGFKVDRGVAGMPTAFVANWSHGTGEPVIGFLAEFDALPGLSQQAGSPKKEPLVIAAPGHGCGHNTMAAMQALTVTALQEIMKRHGISGTLKYYGSPAEEMLLSRPYMIRAGLFSDVAVVIDCHADNCFKVRYGMEGTGIYSFIVTFKGTTTHSGNTPWLGRSAADAVELMHAATERMREHLPLTQRIHWVTLEGGEAPNVVPDRARTWYFVRDLDENLESNFNWVMNCAKGAGLMTQTTYNVQILAAAHQRFGNKVLADLIFENIKAVGKPGYTSQEETFARALQKNVEVPVKGLEYLLTIENSEKGLLRGGSSDVGDVTLVAPTATLRFPAWVPSCPSHHWSVVSSVKTTIAHKGITVGAKAAAFTAFDLLTKPKILAKIRQEFDILANERPYVSFLPNEAALALGWNTRLMEKYRGKMEKFYLNP